MDDSMLDCPRNRGKLLFLYFNLVYSLVEKKVIVFQFEPYSGVSFRSIEYQNCHNLVKSVPLVTVWNKLSLGLCNISV
jgi:hypothetical protein